MNVLPTWSIAISPLTSEAFSKNNTSNTMLKKSWCCCWSWPCCCWCVRHYAKCSPHNPISQWTSAGVLMLSYDYDSLFNFTIHVNFILSMRKLMDRERKVKSNTGTQGVWILSPHIWPLLHSASYFVSIPDDTVADDQAQPKTGFYIQNPITLDVWVTVQGYMWDCHSFRYEYELIRVTESCYTFWKFIGDRR